MSVCASVSSSSRKRNVVCRLVAVTKCRARGTWARGYVDGAMEGRKDGGESLRLSGSRGVFDAKLMIIRVQRCLVKWFALLPMMRPCQRKCTSAYLRGLWLCLLLPGLVLYGFVIVWVALMNKWIKPRPPPQHHLLQGEKTRHVAETSHISRQQGLHHRSTLTTWINHIPH